MERHPKTARRVAFVFALLCVSGICNIAVYAALNALFELIV